MDSTDSDDSEYSEETINNANQAFWLGENGQDNLIQLEYSANKGYKYSLVPYAYHLIYNNGDLKRASELILMSALRHGNESINHELYSLCLEPLSIIKNANKNEIKRWLKNQISSVSIQNAIQVLSNSLSKNPLVKT